MATNHTYDETAGHSVVVAPMAEASPLLRPALFGAYVELVSIAQKSAVAAVQAGVHAQHVAGVVTLGDIISIEPWQGQHLADKLVQYKYLEPMGDTRYRLVQHARLVHWENPETLAWRAAQRKDVRDPALAAAVRLRDGDQCRCCRVLVKWGAPADDPERGTYDHVNPRVLANGNPEALAVTCGSCNGIRSDRPDANEFAPHQPPPAVPFYTASTAKYLRGRGYKGIRATGKAHLLPRITITARPAPKADTAPLSDPTASGTPLPHDPARPATQADTAPPRDPATSGTPRPAVRSQSDSSSLETRLANSPPEPPISRSDDPPARGGLHGGDGKGRVGAGGGVGAGVARPRRHRARRGKGAA